jgi:hypothetical protein
MEGDVLARSGSRGVAVRGDWLQAHASVPAALSQNKSGQCIARLADPCLFPGVLLWAG